MRSDVSPSGSPWGCWGVWWGRRGSVKFTLGLIWHVHRQISVALAGGTLISTAATLPTLSQPAGITSAPSSATGHCVLCLQIFVDWQLKCYLAHVLALFIKAKLLLMRRCLKRHLAPGTTSRYCTTQPSGTQTWLDHRKKALTAHYLFGMTLELLLGPSVFHWGISQHC